MQIITHGIGRESTGGYKMNALDILKYGHLMVLGAVKDLPEADWEMSGVCGIWSVKQIVAHLASYEQLLLDILDNLMGGDPGPTLQLFWADFQGFNDIEVAARQNLNGTQTMAAYKKAQAETTIRLAKIPTTLWSTNGILPWYGAEYDLDDFVVYTYYGHKREHCAQIAVYRDQIKR
jgi:hypothetical protein